MVVTKNDDIVHFKDIQLKSPNLLKKKNITQLFVH